jgi:hypothetical protein
VARTTEAPNPGRLTRGRPSRAAEFVAPLAVVALTVVLLGELWNALGQPFFTDEGWRAYYISGGHPFFAQLRHVPAPLAAGWMLVARVSAALFGNTEAVLRAGEFFALVPLGLLTYALARRLMPPAVAAVCSAALVANTGVLVYATEFKSYVGEAAATSLALIVWLRARRTAQLRAAILLALVAGLLAVYSLPAPFLLAPLAAAEVLPPLWRAIRTRVASPLARAVALAVAVLAPGLLHAATFVRLQSHVSNKLTSYWSVLYLPAGGAGTKLRFLWDQTGTWFTQMIADGMPQPRDKYLPVLPHSGLAAHLTTAALVVGLLASLAAVRRSREVRTVLVALLGCAAVTAVLAGLRIWPFGWSRVNLYVLPLFYVLVGVGATELGRMGYRWLRPARLDLGRRVCGVAAAAGLLVIAAGAAAAGSISARDLQNLRQGLSVINDASQMRLVGLAVRRLAGPRDVAIAAVTAANFSYYVDDYQGYPAPVQRRPTIPDSRMLRLGKFPDPAIGPFVAAHRGAPVVFLFEASGVDSAAHWTDVGFITRYGYRVVYQHSWWKTGVLTVLERRPGG